MRTLAIFTSLAIAAGIALTPASVSAARADTPQFRYRAWRWGPFARPSNRTLDKQTREYRAAMAANRRGFKKQLQKLEAARDAIRKEYRRAESPQYNVDKQGFVPYHTPRFRRSVRHFHWNTEFQQEPEADLGQGHAGQE